jgi:hypothetical protein
MKDSHIEELECILSNGVRPCIEQQTIQEVFLHLILVFTTFVFRLVQSSHFIKEAFHNFFISIKQVRKEYKSQAFIDKKYVITIF